MSTQFERPFDNLTMIGCMGRKGGSGKTMISHLIAHGFARGYDLWTNLLMTDVREEAPNLICDGREYSISALSNKNQKWDQETFLRVVEITDSQPNSFLVTDGGANRANLDLTLAPYCHMVLIPMGPSAEDIKVAETDYFNITNAVAKAGSNTKVFIVRNKWPNDAKRRESLFKKRWVVDFMQRHENSTTMIPAHIPDMQSLLDMADADNPRATPLVDSIAIEFATFLAEILGKELPERKKRKPFFMKTKAVEDVDDGEAPTPEDLAAMFKKMNSESEVPEGSGAGRGQKTAA